MQEDFIIPVALFVSLAFTVTIGLWLRSRGQAQVQKTIRAAIEKGQELSPELLERMSGGIEPNQRDLRRGVVLSGLALAIGVFAVVLGQEAALRPVLGVACFPLLMGIAYLILWRAKR